jgi:sodium/hydrogen exchanger-like protein 6/7
LKHYAYYNMSRRTQLTTKYLFQVLAQLSENFIFIYLGLSLFTESKMEFKPLFIIVTIVGICVARWVAVFPLSRTINWVIRYKAKKRGREAADELPYNYQVMLFWAGLRGAVGVALAAGMTGNNAWALKATVLVVVVLTVIIFGGTTARMLEIQGIKTGVVEEIDSDDEFDIEAVSGGSYYKHAGTAIGHDPRRGTGNGSVALDALRSNGNGRGPERGSYVSGNNSPHNRPSSLSRKGSTNGRGHTNESEQELLRAPSSLSDDEVDVDSDTSDLPPAAKRPPKRKVSAPQLGDGDLGTPYPTSGSTSNADTPHMTATGAISQLLHGTVEDHAAWFKQLDEGFIKPKLLLDGGKGGRHGGPSGS